MMIEQPIIRQLELGPMQNFVYLIGDTKTQTCVVIDPAWQVDTILKTAQEHNFKISAALVTHHHFDHTNGLVELLQTQDIPIYMHQNDTPKMPQEVLQQIKSVHGGETIKIASLSFTFLHTPGHTDGSQCFQIGNALIAGDTLFTNSCGRSDLPDSNPEDLYKSLQKLAKLSDNTILYPGHDYGSESKDSMKSQKENNPILKIVQSMDLDSFLTMMGRPKTRFY